MTNAIQIAQRCYAAATEPHLTRILGDIADYFGADHYGAARFGSTEHGAPANGLTNVSAQTEDELEKLCPGSRDPVMQHLRLTSTPIAWSRATFSTHGLAHLHDAMCDFGMHRGLSLALHLAPTQHFVIGFSWGAGKSVPTSAIADLQLLAINAWPTFNRVWSSLEHDAPLEPLTDRECHCLYWVACGKTDVEIAHRVGITRRTAERDIQSATAKLSAARRTEAAFVAERLGYLEPFRMQHINSRVKRLPS